MTGDVQIFKTIEPRLGGDLIRWHWSVRLDDDPMGLAAAGFATTAADARQDALTALQTHLGQPSARTHEIGAEIDAQADIINATGA